MNLNPGLSRSGVGRETSSPTRPSREVAPWYLSKDDLKIDVAIELSLIINEIDMAVRAARHRLGLVDALRDAVACRIAAGELVEMLQEWPYGVSADNLYYPSRRTVSSAMRAVIDHLRWRQFDDGAGNG